MEEAGALQGQGDFREWGDDQAESEENQVVARYDGSGVHGRRLEPSSESLHMAAPNGLFIICGEADNSLNSVCYQFEPKTLFTASNTCA